MLMELFRAQFQGLSQGVVEDTQNRHGEFIEHFDTQFRSLASSGSMRLMR